MAVSSVAAKPDGAGGTYLLYWYADQTAALWHRVPGSPTHLLIGWQILWKVRAELARQGITEEGWLPG